MLFQDILMVAATAGGGLAFTPASLSPTAWYDPSDISTLFQDSAGTTPVTASGDPVGRMNDKSGNGNHLLQATAAARPLYTVAGALKYLVFDGVDDYMDAGFAISQPWDRISAIKQIALVSATRVFGGYGATDIGLLYMANATDLSVYDGGSIVANRTVSAGTDYVVTERHDNTNSRLALDVGAYGTGTSGAVAAAGVTIASDRAGAGTHVQMNLSGMLMISRALTDPEITSTRTWMAAKQGRVI